MLSGIHLFRVKMEKLEQGLNYFSIKTPERQNQRRFGALIANFEQISDLFLVPF